MIISMTGFGSSEAQIENKSFSLSLRSVNSKTADLNFRIPSFLRDKENEFRSLLIDKLKRGKIDLAISVENGSGESEFQINSSVLLGYMTQMKEITRDMDDLEDDDILSIVSKFPNVVSAEKTDISDNNWSDIMNLLEDSINQLMDYRKQEGLELEKDFVIRIDSITSLSEKVKSLEGERKEKTVEKLKSQLEQLTSNENINEDRFEQELIYYLEKLDITEELVRLDAHLKLFKETMLGETSEGKKLGFISQEIGREINTIGSKANHAEIQRLVVEMKDELEKIKEQLLNIL